MQAITIFVLLILFIPRAYAQSMVDFRNGGVTFRAVANRLVVLCEERLVGTNYVAALYYLPGENRGSELALDEGVLAYGSNSLAYANFRSSSTALPGVWLNPLEVGPYRFLDLVDPGDTATLQIRVWDSTFFPDFRSAVRGGEYYVSIPFNYTVPAPDAPKEDFYMENFRGNSMPCAPRLTLLRSDGAVTLSWSSVAAGYMLEESAAWGGSPAVSWTPVTLPYHTNADRVSITRPIPGGDRFFRLNRQSLP